MIRFAFMLMAVVAAGFHTPAHAQHTWQGDLFLSDVTAACPAANIDNGNFLRGVFRKGGLPGNPGSDTISGVGQRAAFHVSPTGGVLRNASRGTVRSISGRSGYSEAVDVIFSPRVRVTPSSIGTTTATVRIELTVPNFLNVTGCNVTLKGTLAKRPN
jgi:hypothetical protein